MNIVIVGSGNVATIFGRKLKAAGHNLQQIVSRSAANAALLANELGCAHADFSAIDTSADIYIAAIADSALHSLHTKLSLGKKIVVHTAGAVPRDVLNGASVNNGVMYPLQSLLKNMPVVPEIPMLITASNPETQQLLELLAQSIGSKVSHATDAERLRLHVAAVVTSNFSNHLYGLACDFCQKEGVDFAHLLPLIEETATRMRHTSPLELQTGPASRNDVYTLDRHLKTLAGHAKLKYLYIKLTDSIMSN